MRSPIRTGIAARLAGAATVVALSACSDFAPALEPVLRIDVVHWPNEITLAEIDTVVVSLSLEDGTGISGLPLEWTSTDPSVASITPLTTNRAEVRGLGRGSTELAVSYTGSAFRDSVLTRSIEIVGFGITTSWPDTLSVTDSVTLEVELTDSRGRDLLFDAIEWSTSDQDVVDLRPELPPSRARTRLDSLEVERRASLVAEHRGSAEILVVLRRAGVEPVEFRDTIQVMERWTRVVVGGLTACGITVRGRLYCWGADTGHGAATSEEPIAVLGVEGFTFTNVDIGADHVCASTLAGISFCWGENYDGQLGLGTTGPPRALPAVVSGGANFTSISAGGDTTCGVDSRGLQNQQASARLIFCWGYNGLGQFGNSTTQSDSVPTPAGFGGGFSFSYQSVSVGTDHVCGVTDRNSGNPRPLSSAYCWGSNFGGSTPTPVPAPSLTFTQLAAGHGFSGQFTCGLDVSTELWCWGSNTLGQLGDGGTTPQSVPQRVVGGRFYSTVTAGERYVCGLTSYEGEAFCWGWNRYGQLGIGDTIPASSPVPIPVSTGLRFSDIHAGTEGRARFDEDLFFVTTCGVTVPDGAIYCWGAGLLGRAGVSDSYVPIRIAEPLERLPG